MKDRIAVLIVSEELAAEPAFRLPPGFSRGEERYNQIARTVEMQVRGPFPETLSPYAHVSAVVSIKGDELEWQWRLLIGGDLGPPIVMKRAA